MPTNKIKAMLKKKIPDPLTAEQLKEKLKDVETANIVMPAFNGSFGDVSSKDVSSGKVHASIVEIESIGYRQDVVGVNGKGEERIYPGGAWIGLNWSVDGFGFGQIIIQRKSDGKIVIDSERLGKDFVKAILCDLVDKAEVKD